MCEHTGIVSTIAVTAATIATALTVAIARKRMMPRLVLVAQASSGPLYMLFFIGLAY